MLVISSRSGWLLELLTELTKSYYHQSLINLLQKILDEKPFPTLTSTLGSRPDFRWCFSSSHPWGPQGPVRLFFLNFTMDSIYQITRFISNTTITCIGFRVGLTPLKTSSSWTWPCPTWQALALLLDPAIIFIIIIYWTLQWTNFTKCKICLLHLGCNFLTKCISLLHARMTIDNYLAYCYATFLCSLDVEV